MESGTWTTISDSHGGCQSVAEHPVSPPAGRWRFLRNRGANQQVNNSPQAQTRTTGGTGQPRQVGDRASRMRAAIERQQGKKVLQRPAEQANMAHSISPRGGSATPAGSVTPPGSATPRTPAQPFSSAASPTTASRAVSPEDASEETFKEVQSWAMTPSVEAQPNEQVQTAPVPSLASGFEGGGDVDQPSAARVLDLAAAPLLPKPSGLHADDVTVETSTAAAATNAASDRATSSSLAMQIGRAHV